MLQLKKNMKIGRKLKTLSDHPVYSSIYELDLKVIWEKEYRNMSFAMFKHLFHTGDPAISLPFKEFVDPIVELKFSGNHSREKLSIKTKEIINILDIFFRNKAMDKTYFHINTLATYLQSSLRKEKYLCVGIAQVVLQSMQRYGFVSGNLNANNIAKSHETRGFMILPGYQDFINFITRTLDGYLFNQNLTWDEETKTGSLYLPRTTAGNNEKISILFGVLEAFDLVNYQVIGGSDPEIYIRINSVLELERLAKHPDKYRNRILESVHHRHRLSVSMLTYIFKAKMETEEFWDTIEDYFLGKVPDEVIHAAERVGLQEPVGI